jgi:uncharacterized protein YdaU (DUF1376 family)
VSKPDTYMPIVIGDYLKDTMHLEAAEHGAYFLSILHYWANGPLIDDDKKLAAICRVSRADWPAMRETLAPFFQIADGVWRHKRIEAELERARAKRKLASQSAKRRWESENDANAMRTGCGSDANASPRHMPSQCSTTTTSSPESSELYSANNNTESAREKIHALASEIEAVVVAPPEFAFGLPSAVEMMFREGHTELEIMDAARVIAAQGRPIKNPRYLVTTVRNRKSDATRQTPSPRKPRYNPADASSPDAVAERRAALARGMRAILPAGDAGDGTAGG